MTAATQNPSTSRSIISRITSPFSAKPRNISEFYIKIDEPHRHYAPGDKVKGSVVLVVTKAVRITHLVIGIRGFVKVYKNATPPGQGISKEARFVGTGRGDRGSEYFGNGFATIFEKEIPLCGEGRLVPMNYHFEFEVPIRAWEVPSSIDFERGTISYMITSTLTRPTTIAPTCSCDRRIRVVESIDVASVRPPKVRVFSLEPVIRRARSRHYAQASLIGTDDRRLPNQEDNVTLNDLRRKNLVKSRESEGIPQSPVPSEFDSASAVSSSNMSLQIGNFTSRNSQANDSDSVASIVADKTITATAELLSGGCLPGDTVPVRITINHTKPIKSIHGIIVTLYRQGRIDTYPQLPVGPYIEGKKLKWEDLYPQSRTGLGGLSLSAGGTIHVYRMDLAQTFAPLIVDPIKMTAVIQTSLRIPKDVFPTISCVPGDIISFRYFVEVVIDLGGKLASQGRFFPRWSMTDVPSPSDYVPGSCQPMSSATQNENVLATNFTDTSHIRRERSVVFCSFELTVGTKDTNRKVAKQSNGSRQEHRVPQPPSGNHQSPSETNTCCDTLASPRSEVVTNVLGRTITEDYTQYLARDVPLEAAALFVPPVIEEPVDEKTRMRRAEEYLLPSSPPLDDEDRTSIATHPMQASAPTLGELEDAYQYSGHSAPVYTARSATTMPTAFSHNDLTINTGNPNANSLESCEHLGTEQGDKQELERQRLLAEASAPDFGADDDTEMFIPQASPEPCAPVLDEDSNYQSPQSQDSANHPPNYRK